MWKGLLQDGGNPNVPAYMVACKVVKEATGSLDVAGTHAAEEELLKEALLMAQVETHEHLVALVGVITRGSPKVLVLSFCEHGELQGALKKRAADGDAFSHAAKRGFCEAIAGGMAHLAHHNFVHRDLAARNVLLGSGMVCKVADFGLSRRVQTEDNTGDYYRSSSGIIPVRWTAPEGITGQKFSTASDVWSFGITCAEIFQDGGHPYPGIKSNPEVIKAVCTDGQVHPRPKGCTLEIYDELLQCWSFDPDRRPSFARLAAFFVPGDLAARTDTAAHLAPGPRSVAHPPPGRQGVGTEFLPSTAGTGTSQQRGFGNDRSTGGQHPGEQYDLGFQDVAGGRYNLGYHEDPRSVSAVGQLSAPRALQVAGPFAAKPGRGVPKKPTRWRNTEKFSDDSDRLLADSGV